MDDESFWEDDPDEEVDEEEVVDLSVPDEEEEDKEFKDLEEGAEYVDDD